MTRDGPKPQSLGLGWGRKRSLSVRQARACEVVSSALTGGFLGLLAAPTLELSYVR